MAVFSINQVRHLYVEKAAATGTTVLESDAAGTILPKGDGNKKVLYFQYKSPAGVICSDKVETDKILNITVKKAADLAHKLKVVKLTLDSTVSDAVIAGQEYITRVTLDNFIGMGEENTHVVYGDVYGTANMSTSDFYKAMAISLAKNSEGYVTVYLEGNSSDTKVTSTTKADTLTETYTGIKVEEAVQEWQLGTVPEAFIGFNVQTAAIIVNGEEMPWGTVEDITAAGANVVGNGHKIADLEYFCMGARGDYYRNMGFPYTIKTTYLVDPDATYDVLNIHYYFSGSNESVQKSEKDLTIVADSASSNALMTALVTKINALLPTEKAITFA